jgi:protein tyrosine/serine phosphatase
MQRSQDSRRVFTPASAYFNMLFVDHGIVRLVHLNLHRLSDKAWRSAQPAPHQIRALAQRGIRTIVNLRGERLCGSYWLEQAACKRHGIALVNLHMRSRRAPTREELRAAVELFNRIEYPMLMHCKSGAERTGLMSILYLFLKEGVPLTEARRQLSPRYGYFRHTNAGILDLLIEHYSDDNRRQPVLFAEWLKSIYDPEKLTRAFHAKSWSRRLTDQVLRKG